MENANKTERLLSRSIEICEPFDGQNPADYMVEWLNKQQILGILASPFNRLARFNPTVPSNSGK